MKKKTPRQKRQFAAASVASVAAASLWSRTRKALERVNHAKLWLTLAFVSLTFMIGGYHFKDRNGLVIGFFVALAMNALVFFYDEWRLLDIFPATEIEGRDPWGLLALTRCLARASGAPQPSLYEIPSETPFLFSAGLIPTRLKIFVSSSLVKRLTADELQAVITHELLRSQTGITQLATAAAAIADLWLMAARTVDAVLTMRFLWARRRRKSRVFCGPLSCLSFPVVALFLRLVIRRKNYLSVDRMAASQIGKESALVTAFMKLDAYGKNLPLDVNLAEAALFTVNPLSLYRWSRWTSVQPSLEIRATALTGHFPL